ncbi:2-oxo-4-hydroxy-4-carboxy-5-ureidoimidazoline decarboxylase [Microbacterium sp. CFH 31415]|uniref:2-oxo-4-hydroxy-4-carboxy-5-ureidoimidazoline decarboxylase n=1 Tax=Microbacterium sp. CFH 31415 TaxID=2921732 RepID=UPI001F142894|nr:2-oxo-4-hydroxy-4-carboxy-5-ureidoimidazoline decarboxylase [Microbacterium sp. CFH 31415]MCH6229191.1 2-oxo-4-hydroxy-4-carboxy-5-ureidoimidazoline decarboxylase [Microbacterium sp. CFH 31415]
MRREEFNRADRADAIAALRTCADVTRWCEQVADRRPYASVDELLAEAARAADPFTPDEVEAALAHHPRIGERARGDSREATLSRAEQAAVDPADVDVQRALQGGNRAYEERFGRVFLIRAAGRGAPEILAALRTRLENDPDAEAAVVGEQLREIALLRLEGMVQP